ncbi:MAG TPA: branched-chain amino acid ABC transporter permease [Polyangiaceae bacterium]|nr:branched-chain amino acid ABC transporter permease [Polyangiaceae bacterium]
MLDSTPTEPSLASSAELPPSSTPPSSPPPNEPGPREPRPTLRLLVSAGLVVILWGLGFLIESQLIEYVQRILLLCGVNIVLAVGLNLINGTTGQFSIGHAGFMAVGAYTAAYLGVHLAPALEAALGAGVGTDALVLNLALLGGALLAGFAGLLIGMPSLRLRGDYLAVVTLGFGEIIRILFTNAEFLGSATGYFGDSLAGLRAYSSFFWVYLWVLLVVVGIRNLTFSQTGRSLVAIREDEIAAESIAAPSTRLKVQAFVISAATAGIAGGLFAHMQAGIRPEDFRFEKSIDMLVMIIVGGLGSISGAIIGGVFVAVTLELMRDLAQYRLVVYALLLIIVMIGRPKGLLGSRELSELWRRAPGKTPEPVRGGKS